MDSCTFEFGAEGKIGTPKIATFGTEQVLTIGRADVLYLPSTNDVLCKIYEVVVFFICEIESALVT